MLGDWLEPRLSLDYNPLRYSLWSEPTSPHLLSALDEQQADHLTDSADAAEETTRLPHAAAMSDGSASSGSDTEASLQVPDAPLYVPEPSGPCPRPRQRWVVRPWLSAAQGSFTRSWSSLDTPQGLVTADSDPSLLEDGVLARGPLVLVRGWWRNGPKLVPSVAEIRTLRGDTGWQLVWRRLRREGYSDRAQVQSLDDLGGTAVESIDLPQHPGLYGFRVHPLPRACKEYIDFATESLDERTKWLHAFAQAARHESEADVPLCGRLSVTVNEANIHQERSIFRRQSAASPELFALVRWGPTGAPRSLESRSAPKRAVAAGSSFASQSGSTVGGGSSSSSSNFVKFRHTCQFPLTDDDPDSLISIEVWSQDTRRRSHLCGRVDVPLYCLGRNEPCHFTMPLRDVMRPRGEGSEVGTVSVECRFQQPLSSLLLPRPLRQTPRPWHIVGNTPIREQLKEFEAFLREFEVFSSRFMHHCDRWRQVSFIFRRIVQWDSTLLTLACLLGLTIVIGFFHEYALPLIVLALLCITAWLHPWWRDWRARAAQQLGNHEYTEGHQYDRVEVNRVPEHPGAQLKVRFENERRLMFGKFTHRRLRLFDPPHWCDAEGHQVKDPREDPTEDSMQYMWRVEVNQFTDSDGWQYAKCFGRGALWRSTFQYQMNVRRRKYIGVPVTSAASGASEKAPMVGGRASRAGLLFFQRPSTAGSSAPPQQKLLTPRGGHEAVAKGPEFGLARTPYHDMYQQYLLRWAYLQRHIEFWMDWYERRKNLFIGVTLPTQNFALLGVFMLLVAAWTIPTRWLVLTWVYTFFYDGLETGKLMRRNQDTFIRALKDTALTLWLRGDAAKERSKLWGPSTTLDDVAGAGVQLLMLRDWIRDEFFDGRPMVPLRAVQRCGTLGELAVQVTWTSDKFVRQRQRPRVWYRSTFRNLLDHVPSDVTLFQPLTCLCGTEMPGG